MGALTSAVGTLVSAANILMPMKNSGEATAAQNRQLQQNAALQKQKNLLTLEQTESNRLAKLRKSIAAQRASMAGRGIEPTGGSADAVLQGLVDDSNAESQNSYAQTALDNARIDANLGSETQLNLLQKEQMKQKTALNSIGYFNKLQQKD